MQLSPFLQNYSLTFHLCSKETKQKMDNEKNETEEDHLPLATLKARKKHAKLMQELIIRFINKSKMKQKKY